MSAETDRAELEEKLSLVQRERGYVVMATYDKRRIGQVCRDLRLEASGPTTGLPARVISETTLEDFIEQLKISWPEDVLRMQLGSLTHPIYFYRVETD